MEQKLIKYFSKYWKPDYTHFKYTGYDLVDKIGPYKTILDIGCGYNLFKPFFNDLLYGIDPANKAADEMVSIEDFKSDRHWDIILCLGSINFGDEATIKNQIRKAVSFLKPNGKIYWRQNPGIGDHPWKGVEDIEFFPWDLLKNCIYAEEFGCELIEFKWDNSNRIYAEWRNAINKT